MKRLILIMAFVFSAFLCFAQKGAITYDDMKFLLHNNLMQADTFLTIKGYVVTKKDNANKIREYHISGVTSDLFTTINLRLDGKRMYIELETNQPNQFTLIHDSIQEFLDKNSAAAGVQTYAVKNLGTIYITSQESPDGNPLKRDYDIHIIADKHLTISD